MTVVAEHRCGKVVGGRATCAAEEFETDPAKWEFHKKWGPSAHMEYV